mgnify:CR=1 FL=1
MAQIDVSELMTDPDFVDKIQVITRTPAVNSLGENFIREVTTDSVGSVQPADYKTMKRLPEALQNENVSSFWVKGQILTTEDCKYPSILVFRKKRYQIERVADWSNFGAGYCEGICIAEKPA